VSAIARIPFIWENLPLDPWNLLSSIASSKDAKRFLDKYKRVDIAIDAYYNESSPTAAAAAPKRTINKLNVLFDKYKGA
jgi:hypothetical protein